MLPPLPSGVVPRETVTVALDREKSGLNDLSPPGHVWDEVVRRRLGRRMSG